MEEDVMRKLAIFVGALVCVCILSSAVLARWWDHKPILRKEYTRWGMLKKLELTAEQVKLIKAHEKAVEKEFHEGLFSILNKKQIKRREQLIERRQEWKKKKIEELKKKLDKIEDEEKREAMRQKLIDAVEWQYYLREYFFRQDVKALLKKIKEHKRDNDNDDSSFNLGLLNKLQKKIDRIRAFYFKWEVRCRLGLSWAQHKAIHERDRIRDENWEAGLKEILTEEQYEFLQELRKERHEFYKKQGDKFKKRLKKLVEENGEDWNPFKGNKGDKGNDKNKPGRNKPGKNKP
jgi:membrane-associated HD superfamily phosphohydrolase